MEGPPSQAYRTTTVASSRSTATAGSVEPKTSFAAGDAADFPIKQGGLAAQQADAAAEAIAAAAGSDLAPQPFDPVLRGLLVTGAEPHFRKLNTLHADFAATMMVAA